MGWFSNNSRDNEEFNARVKEVADIVADKVEERLKKYLLNCTDLDK